MELQRSGSPVVPVVAKICEFIFKRILKPIFKSIFRSIARRSQRLCGYDKKFKRLEEKEKELQAKIEEINRLIGNLMEPPAGYKDWETKWVEICDRQVRRICSERRDLSSGLCWNWCCNVSKRRFTVARVLKKLVHLDEEFMESVRIWMYPINIMNLKKKVEENLMGEKQRVMKEIKDGEQPSRNVQIWLDDVDEIIEKLPEMIHLSQQKCQNCKSFICWRCIQSVEVAEQKVKKVNELLLEAKDFNEFSRETGETVYNRDLLKLKQLVEKLLYMENDVQRRIEADGEPNEYGSYWLGEVRRNADEVTGLIGEYSHAQHKRVTELSDEAQLLMQFRYLPNQPSLDPLNYQSPSFDTFQSMELTLNEEEAWILFKNTAGTCIDCSYLTSIAMMVAKKCEGIPLAIVVVAKAMEGNTSKSKWRDALERLQNPYLQMPSRPKAFYTCIKLSYDYLDDELKEIFLLCSCMGNTQNAYVEDLLRYALSLEKFNKLSIERAVAELSENINRLKALSLLLDAPDTDRFGHSFRVHDFVCAVAREIASENSMFNEPDGHLPLHLSNKNALIKCTSITLYNIEELPEYAEWDCPNLKFLYMKSKFSWLKVPNNFFSRMESLQVLHLMEMDLSSQSSLPVNLLTLCLEDCLLQDFDWVGDMTDLKFLSCRGSDIQKLPEKLRQLTGIRLLDLRDCGKLTSIPLDLVSSLTRVEALYMNDPSIIFTGDGSFEGLSHLEILEMCLPDMKTWRSLNLSKLTRYKITLGERFWFHQEPNSLSRSLRLSGNLDDWVTFKWSGVQALQLMSCSVTGGKNLLHDSIGTDFLYLKYLIIGDSDASLIINYVSSADFPALEFLEICNMYCLETICDKSLIAFSFSSLRTLRVSYCAKLSNIFRFASALGVLINLTELLVYDCPNMKGIIAIEEQDDCKVVRDILLLHLRHVCLDKLPSLKGFWGKTNRASELQLDSGWSTGDTISMEELNYPLSLFDEKVQIPNLKTLYVKNIQKVEIISHYLHPKLSFCVQNLTELTLSHCWNLRVLFQSSMEMELESCTVQLPVLKSLRLEFLDKLTSLCTRCYIDLPSLEHIFVRDCPELMCILDDKAEVHNLNSLEVISCKKLWTLFPSSICGSIFRLRQLYVKDCKSLEHLGEINSEDNACTSEIEILKVSYCPNLKHLFVSEGVVPQEAFVEFLFPKLIDVKLHGLPELNMFYPVKHNVVVPILKRLELCECGVKDHEAEGQMQLPIHLLQQDLPCLEELTSSAEEIKALSQVQFPVKLFFTIKNLRLKTDPSNLLSLGIIQRFQNLENLIFTGDTQVFSHECFEDMEDISSPGQVKKLVLENLSDVKFIGEQGSNRELIVQNFDYQVLSVHNCDRWPPFSLRNLTTLTVIDCDNLESIVDVTMAESLKKLERLHVRFCKNVKEVIQDQVQLQNLEFLIVESCPKLMNLTHASASFPNLTMLEVSRCDSLETVLKFAVAKSLGKLDTMYVAHCENVCEVVQHEGDQTEEMIIFQNLKILRLENLFRLTSFCSGHFTLEFPVIEELIIMDCYSMKSFSPGQLFLPRLQNVQIRGRMYRLSLDTDLNTMVKATPKELETWRESQNVRLKYMRNKHQREKHNT